MKVPALITILVLCGAIVPRHALCNPLGSAPGSGAFQSNAHAEIPAERSSGESNIQFGATDDQIGSDRNLLQRRRKKRHLAWEEAEREFDGLYARYYETCKRMHPQLSPMECRVCALAKARLPNWRIAEMLQISSRTVENHVRSVRTKLGLPKRTRLSQGLASLEIAAR